MLRLGQQGRVRFGATDHRDPVALPRKVDHRLGRARERDADDRRRGLVPVSADQLPDAPFAEYSSGHSNFSAAGAEILKLFTGSDRFGGSVTLPAGSSRVEPGLVPARDVTLTWATFSDAAAQAGISRRLGGIHFTQGDHDARATGRAAARHCWAAAHTYFDGTAPSPT